MEDFENSVKISFYLNLLRNRVDDRWQSRDETLRTIQWGRSLWTSLKVKYNSHVTPVQTFCVLCPKSFCMNPNLFLLYLIFTKIYNVFNVYVVCIYSGGQNFHRQTFPKSYKLKFLWKGSVAPLSWKKYGHLIKYKN